MAIDLTQFGRNNLKRYNHAAVGTVKAVMSRGTTLTAGEEHIVGVIPPRSLIVSMTVVIHEGFNGTTPAAAIAVGGTTIKAAQDLTAVGVFNSTATGRINTGVSSKLVTVTPTADDSTVGELQVVIEYIELDATTGMYSAEQ